MFCAITVIGPFTLSTVLYAFMFYLSLYRNGSQMLPASHNFCRKNILRFWRINLCVMRSFYRRSRKKWKKDWGQIIRSVYARSRRTMGSSGTASPSAKRRRISPPRSISRTFTGNWRAARPYPRSVTASISST